jgi:O-antigen/teichoic acid export membrane protein
MLKNKTLINVGWIVIGRIIQAVLSLIIGVFTTRALGPANYGLINYAGSLVSFCVPIMQLGFDAILVQTFVEEPDCEGETLGTAFACNVCSGFLCIVGLSLFCLFIHTDEPTTILVCLLYSIRLIFQASENIQYWFQAKLMSKYYTIAMLAAYGVVSVYKVYLLFTHQSVYWFALSYALDHCLITVILYIAYRRLSTQPLRFSWKRFLRLLSRSRHYIVSALVIVLHQQMDKIMLKLIIDEVATGIYSAAVTCAGMIGFVYGAMIDSARPGILKSKLTDQDQYEDKVSFLYGAVFYVAFLQTVVTLVCADLMVFVLFGEQYAESANVLRVCVLYISFSYFGSIRNVWLQAENKQKYLWLIDLFGSLMNIVLNFALIIPFGALGAALATVLTQFFTSVVLVFIMKPLRGNVKLFLQGLNPVWMLKHTKSYLKK